MTSKQTLADLGHLPFLYSRRQDGVKAPGWFVNLRVLDVDDLHAPF